MFSQWKQAVESLAQHSPKPSLDGSIPSEEHAARGSLDAAGIGRSLASSTQLADSALSSLRKTLVAQRPASPVSKTAPATEISSPRPRTTLEDRLRAKFAIGDASNGTSPSQSVKSSPTGTPTPALDHPLSPAPPSEQPSPSPEPAHPLSPKSTPLPESPVVGGSVASLVPLARVTSHPLSPVPDGVESKESKEDSPAPEKGDEGLSKVTVTEEEPVVPTSEEKPSPSLAEDWAEEAVGEPTTPTDETHPPETEDAPAIVVSAEVEPAVEPINEPTGTVAEVETGEITSPAVEEAEPAKDEQLEIALDSVEAVVEEPQSPSVGPQSSSVDIIPPVETEAHAEEQTHDPKPSEPVASNGPDIEALQQRLKLVEQRFSDVSTSFKRIQAEKVAADRVLSELTSVESIKEADALRDFLQNMNLKVEMAQDEIKRLNGKLTRQEERVEELRDIHRLESKSQSEQIDKLRGQVDEAEALLKASQGSTTQLEDEVTKKKSEVERLNTEVEKLKSSVKDEEEKRTKAVALLKTVRQKLVKAEKERDEATKEVHAVKEKGKEELDKERSEKQRLHEEIQKVNIEREVALQGLKAQFDKEVAALKDRQEKELSALRGQYELEMITTKSLHSRETEANNARISDLEASVRILTGEKDDIFDQLQMRQAELESSQSHLESLQSQTVELQYQLRESTDRIALLTDELTDSRKERAVQSQGGPSTEEVTRLLSATESKYESRIADLRRQVAAVERERDEAETMFNKRVSEKAKEVAHLQSLVNASTKSHEEDGETVSMLQKEIESLKEASRVREQLMAELRAEAGKVTEVESAAQMQIAEIKSTVAALQQSIEESKAREGQLRAHNKTLREELRKVQSSAALLERQRNPGVGYWGSRTEGTPEPRSPTSSSSDLPRENSSRPSSPSTAKSDEEVNYEYLRNVILQFLEHKEMRPHLIKILSTILRFTPQETRRLISKV